MFLPAEIMPVLAHFAPVFTAPTYQKALVLIVGTILAKGRRTVTSALRVVGHTQTADWAKYHHMLNRCAVVWVGAECPAPVLVGGHLGARRRHHRRRGRDVGTPLGAADLNAGIGATVWRRASRSTSAAAGCGGWCSPWWSTCRGRPMRGLCRF